MNGEIAGEDDLIQLITDEEEDKLQKARVFTNMLKHFKNQYPSWEEGIKHFLEGFEVLEKHQILII